MFIETHLCLPRKVAFTLFFLSLLLDTFLHKTAYVGPPTFMLANPNPVLSVAVLSKDTQEASHHVLFQAEGVPAHAVYTFHLRLSHDVTLLPPHVTPRNEFCVSGAETWPKSCVLKPSFESSPHLMTVFEFEGGKLRFREKSCNLNPQLARGHNLPKKGSSIF